jgi:hypothetical protein
MPTPAVSHKTFDNFEIYFEIIPSISIPYQKVRIFDLFSGDKLLISIHLIIENFQISAQLENNGEYLFIGNLKLNDKNDFVIHQVCTSNN